MIITMLSYDNIKYKRMSKRNCYCPQSLPPTSYREVEYSFDNFAEILKKNKVLEYDKNYYFQLSKDERRKIKMNSGFILGFKRNGKWYRNGISMDVDFFGNEFLKAIKSFKYTYILHSTPSSIDDNKHFHLLIPLNNVVDSTKYKQIYDKISNELGNKYFDNCFRHVDFPIFMPMSLKGEDYIFIYNKGLIYNAK